MTTSMFDLTGKRAVVTGGGSGIGLAIARGLLQWGAEVCLWGRDEGRLDAARASLGEHGRVLLRRVDVSDEDAVVRGMTDSASELGSLDVLVVNAGVALSTGAFPTSTTDHYRDTLAVNLDGAYWTLREGSRLMVEQQKAGGSGGSIIAVSSLAAVLGAGFNQAYAASKAGLLAMANGAAVELARYDVRVNTILPGWVATEMSAPNQESDAFTQRVISRVPQRRWGAPEDFAGAAVYLASDASRFQTASTMVIDGGYSMF